MALVQFPLWEQFHAFQWKIHYAAILLNFQAQFKLETDPKEQHMFILYREYTTVWTQSADEDF